MTISITPFEAPTYLHLELDSFGEELDFFGAIEWAYVFIDGASNRTVKTSCEELLEQLSCPEGTEELAFQTLVWVHGMYASEGRRCPAYTAYDAKEWILRKRRRVQRLLQAFIKSPHSYHYEYIEDLI